MTAKSGTSTSGNARNQPIKSPFRKSYSKSNFESDSNPNKPATGSKTSQGKTPTRPKSIRKAMKSPIPTAKSTPLPEMSLAEIEAVQAMLLDPKYLQDKSVKKPSLATLKRKKRQMQQEEKDSNALVQQTKGTYKSTLNQKDQAQSIQDMKNAYRNKKFEV